MNRVYKDLKTAKKDFVCEYLRFANPDIDTNCYIDEGIIIGNNILFFALEYTEGEIAEILNKDTKYRNILIEINKQKAILMEEDKIVEIHYMNHIEEEMKLIRTLKE